MLDPGCGSAPLFQVAAERSWVGLDTSAAEFGAARSAGAGPLPPRDRVAVAGLIAALGRSPAYPAGRGMPRIPALLAGHGLRVTADSHRRSGCQLRGPAAADQFLSSLYPPGTSAARCRLARGYLRFLALFRYEMPVPLRRIVAERAGG